MVPLSCCLLSNLGPTIPGIREQHPYLSAIRAPQNLAERDDLWAENSYWCHTGGGIPPCQFWLGVLDRKACSQCFCFEGTAFIPFQMWSVCLVFELQAGLPSNRFLAVHRSDGQSSLPPASGRSQRSVTFGVFRYGLRTGVKWCLCLDSHPHRTFQLARVW